MIPAVALPPQPDGVPFPTTDWPLGTPPAGIQGPLDELLAEAFPEPGPNGTAPTDERFGLSLAVVVVHGGRIVAERYGPTTHRDEALISWSMAKSFAQALIGVLVAEGRLDITKPAPIAQWSQPGDPRASITTDQLLRMVPGTRFNEDYVDETTSHCIEMLFGDGRHDMAGYTAELPLDTEPDTHFNYSSGTSVLVCRILADIVGSGDEFESWMKAVLLDPLGIDAELTFDDQGTWVGSSFLHTTARHFAKFGLLYLRDGVWDGQRLLPEGWVDYARTARACDDTGSRYGAHWWVKQHDDEVFYASGYETQRIIVDPRSDLVVVRLGKTPTETADHVDAWLDRIRALFSDCDR